MIGQGSCGTGQESGITMVQQSLDIARPKQSHLRVTEEIRGILKVVACVFEIFMSGLPVL